MDLFAVSFFAVYLGVMIAAVAALVVVSMLTSKKPAAAG